MLRIRVALLLAALASAAYSQYDVPTFQGDRQRTGWIAKETTLTPANVSAGSFGPIWNSPQFDS